MSYVDKQAREQVDVKIRWITYINPTDGGNKAFGTCVFGDYVAIVGWASPKQYVALLRKSNGSIARDWIGDGGMFFNCISIGEKLYVVGNTGLLYGVIYVFDENLNILERIIKKSFSNYFSLAYDDKALYIGGAAGEDTDGDGEPELVGLVEKITLDTDTLSIEKSKIMYFGLWKGGWIQDVGEEPSTGRIWAVGWYYDSNGKGHSLIVILDGDLRVLRRIDYPEGSEGFLGGLYGIAFDSRHVYVSGREGVAKFTRDGELVAINRDGKTRYKIAYYNNYLYTFGEDRIRGYYRHVLDIFDTNLNLVKSYVLSENVNANSHFSLLSFFGRPALEGNNVYVAGYDEALGERNTRGVVYSLSLRGEGDRDHGKLSVLLEELKRH